MHASYILDQSRTPIARSRYFPYRDSVTTVSSLIDPQALSPDHICADHTYINPYMQVSLILPIIIHTIILVQSIRQDHVTYMHKDLIMVKSLSFYIARYIVNVTC